MRAEDQKEGTAVTFEPCADESEPRQRWRFSADRFSYEETVDNKTGSLSCLGLMRANTVNSPVIMTERGAGGNCGVNAPGKTSGFFPSPEVGPGSAGSSTKKLVNYGEVGRCLDVSDDDVTGGRFKIMSPTEGLR